MKIKKNILILIIILPLVKIFSQTNMLDPIIDTSANYSGNLSYNTGEVYVVYAILNQPIVSKDSNDIIDDSTEKSIVKGISIYPNPVTNVLTIITSDMEKVQKIQLYSMDGKMISDQQIPNNQLDLSNLQPGTYILKVYSSQTTNFKIIKR